MKGTGAAICKVSFYMCFAYAFTKQFTPIVFGYVNMGAIVQYGMPGAAADVTHVYVTFVTREVS